jgi:hypothetical protein
MRRNPHAELRLRSKRALAPLILVFAVGCTPLFSPEGSGCEPPPPATDAASPFVWLSCRRLHCIQNNEAVRGTDPYLVVQFNCPGVSGTFLAAVKVDGQIASMHEVECAGYGSLVAFDAGSWEPADTVWHTVEVVLDPLNLFKESNETNNRGSARLRIVEPRGTTVAAGGFETRGGR